MKYYTGIGSRDTPQIVLDKMMEMSKDMESQGYILRSGGAGGADTAFYNGLIDKTKSEIYVPWASFLNRNDDYNDCTTQIEIQYNHKAELDSYVDRLHPNPMALSQGARKLMMRNVYQVLGQDLNSPSELVVCYTKDGKLAGGTAFAMRLAIEYNIPVNNLNDWYQDALKEANNAVHEPLF